MFDIKLIGTNEYGGSSATILELSALDGYTTVDVVGTSLDLAPSFEGDIVRFTDGSTKNYGILVKKGLLKVYPVVYNDVGEDAVTFDNYYTIIPPLQCYYHYIYCQDYLVQFGTDTKAFNIDILTLTPNIEGNGLKQLDIEYELNRGL